MCLRPVFLRLLHVYADETTAVTIHRDFYSVDDNHLDLRYLLFVRMQDGKMAKVGEVPFDQPENGHYLAVQGSTLALAVKP
jgi:ketosteroid isomerase-like protein